MIQYQSPAISMRDSSTVLHIVEKESPANRDVFYLKGLNGLRAIAAIAVVVTHILFATTGKLLFLGGFSVTIFFTLSGFLITLLLMRESKGLNGRVEITQFYKRRILRIWPLYFLYMLTAIPVSQLIGKSVLLSQIPYYVFFVPNIPFLAGGYIELMNHYWSLGVEEQFYIFWPWLIKLFCKYVPLALSCFIGCFLALKTFLHHYYGFNSLPYMFTYYCRFDCMAIGGLGGYLYFKNFKGLAIIKHFFFQLLAWLVMVLVCIDRFHLARMYDHEILSCITIILIVNQAGNPKNLISLENGVLNFLGKISYGIYVIHPMVIAVTLYVLKAMAAPFITAITWPVVFAITIFLSYLSHRFFESYFLKLKYKPLFKAPVALNR
ncbi:MAG TPA: acyltransferase [Chitinophagaceae bacterium]|nr:acyltransferase [Chitinophagaceae bacterium]